MRYTRHLRQLGPLLSVPIAHRGLHDVAKNIVENTKGAFAAAIDKNYAIECDIQLSADGEAMVFHDEKLDRITTGTGEVRHYTTAELKKLSFRHSTDKTQTLSDLLLQVKGQVPLIVEIKSLWDSDPRLTLRAVATAQQYAGPLAFMSFDPAIVSLLAHQAPNRIRGIVADRTHGPYYDSFSVARRIKLRSLSHLPHSRPHFVSYDCDGLPFPPIQQLRAEGMPVITWTITSAVQASRARRYSDQITFENYHPE
jgi:glycerophosphoryl diester phosphodiesterase